MEKKAKLGPLQEPKTSVIVIRGLWINEPSGYRVTHETCVNENNRGYSCKYTDAVSWKDAWEVAQDVAKDSSSIWFSLRYCGDRIEDLPPQLSFISMRNITSLTIQYYPTLEHLDLRGLSCLQILDMDPVSFELRDNHTKNQLPLRIRISGLARCLKLRKLILFWGMRGSYVLKVKAPIRNLQALTHVLVGSSCLNRRLPLELGASPSLAFAMFNDMNVLQTLKRGQNVAVCLCLALHANKMNISKSTAFIKAFVSGPIHDPSGIFRVVNKRYVNLS